MTTIYATHAANWAETVYTAGEVAGKLFSPTQAVPYSFEAA